MGTFILYLGLDPSRHDFDLPVIHYPVIKIQRKPFSSLQSSFFPTKPYTHLIFTSRSAVQVFQKCSEHWALDFWSSTTVIAVGRATAQLILPFGPKELHIAEEETAEGVISLIQQLPRGDQDFYFWPHSSLSRPVISQFLERESISFVSCDLYETECVTPLPKPDLSRVRTIVFTSPSTVEGFLQAYSSFPEGVELQCIGPITQKKLLREVAQLDLL